MSVIREIIAHLGQKPRTATELSESAMMPIEDVYHSLVWLHDRGAAKIVMSGHTSKVSGWVEVKA